MKRSFDALWSDAMNEENETLDPTNDFLFKRLFADPCNERLLLDLIRAVLGPGVDVIGVKVVESTVLRDKVKDKTIVLDILVETEDGTKVAAEMQSRNRGHFMARIVFYWARLLVDQLQRGGDYATIKPTIVIAFTGYEETAGDALHTVFTIEANRRDIQRCKLMELHLVEFPKAARVASHQGENPRLVLWARYFAARNHQQRELVAQEDDVIAQAHRVLRELSAIDEVRQAFHLREIELRTFEHDLEARHEQGLAEGLAIGETKGRTEGRIEGRTEGRVEGTLDSLMMVLSSRGIPITPDARRTMALCSDAVLANRWLMRALTMGPDDDLFAD